MATMIQQQMTKMGSSTFEPLTQKRLPLVHILTSKPENDDEKVRSLIVNSFSSFESLSSESRTIQFRKDH